MIGSKAGAAGANRSCRQSTKRKLDTKRDPVGVAGVSGSGDGGSGFFGVRESSTVVEIKKCIGDHNLYLTVKEEKHVTVEEEKHVTVKEEKLVAAIIHDVFRLCEDLNHPESSLNIRNVELCIQKEIQKEAQINLPTIGKKLLVEFMKRNPVKLSDDSPDAQFPLKLEGLTKEQFGVLKEKIEELARQCFRELREKIIGDYGIQGRQRMDLKTILPRLTLPEDNGSQVDDPIKALSDLLAKAVAEVPPSNGKSMDAKKEAVRDFITHLQVDLKKLESSLMPTYVG